MKKISDTELAYKFLDLAKKYGADEADVAVMYNNDISYTHRYGKAEFIEKSESKDLGLRVFIYDKTQKAFKTAIISTNNFADSESLKTVEAAINIAKLNTADEHTRLAEKEEFCTNISDNLELYSDEEIHPQQLIDIAAQAEGEALSHKGIINSEGAVSSDSTTAINLVTSKGFAGSYKLRGFSINVSVLAGDNNSMETDYDFNYSRKFSLLKSPIEIGKVAAERTLAKINPVRLKTQKCPLVFDRRVSKNIVLALVNAINGGTVAKKSSFLVNKLDKQIFPQFVTITDNPLLKMGISSQPFDAEGLFGNSLNLVDKGVLTHWITDIKTASKLGEKSSGRAARSVSSSPQPYPTNVYMHNGSETKEGLISSVKNGVYITELFGMGVNNVTGDFSQGAAGFLIENGEITKPVSQFTIAGNLIDMFQNVIPANDLEFRYSKNAPTILINGMTVAGQ